LPDRQALKRRIPAPISSDFSATISARRTRQRQAEAAEKSIIIERIIVRAEDLGAFDSVQRRKSELKQLTVGELEELAGELLAASTGRETADLVVEAITASAAARRLAEDAKYDGLVGPAEVTM
jgi:hypothetical protein